MQNGPSQTANMKYVVRITQSIEVPFKVFFWEFQGIKNSPTSVYQSSGEVLAEI